MHGGVESTESEHEGPPRPAKLKSKGKSSGLVAYSDSDEEESQESAANRTITPATPVASATDNRRAPPGTQAKSKTPTKKTQQQKRRVASSSRQQNVQQNVEDQFESEGTDLSDRRESKRIKKGISKPARFRGMWLLFETPRVIQQ